MTALEIWFLILSYLCIKCYSNSLLQGYARLRSKSFRHEDDMLFVFKGRHEYSGKLSSLDKRASDAWRNDLENIPFFLLLLLGFALITQSASWTLLYGVMFSTSRTLHTIFLLYPKQPWRHLCFQAASITSFFVLGHVVYFLLR